jgi:hypothetical protein
MVCEKETTGKSMNIWVKIIREEKVCENTVIAADNLDRFSGITQAFMTGAEALKISTPVITRTAAQLFFDFNSVRFRPRDFVEAVDFDFLEFEICKD